MLTTRLTIGLSMVGGFLAILALDEWYEPWYPLWFATSMVVMGHSALEVVGMLQGTSARPSGNTVFGGVLAIVIANWTPHVLTYLTQSPQMAAEPAYDASLPVHVLAWPLWTFVAVVMFAFIGQSAQFDRPGHTMATIAGTVLAVAYVGILGSFIIQFRWLPHGAVPLAALVAAAKGADTGAYTFGRLAGRHKLWPRLSPNKTVEGALGGMVFGLLAVLIIFAVARYGLHVPTLTWPAAIGFGLIVSATAQLGDLMESMIKRDCAVKDASTAVPGFGGVLDVMDSLLFAGPVAYGYWLAFGP
ncbi:MAG TPA: phosphatidate cytidylyltransferase [Isosphaeraceae bacterium]|jgi:phosphatidate cytidylyltransferase|nr:phosphatidate cytidylyltransferase [Isosphaeraceae bacterium]